MTSSEGTDGEQSSQEGASGNQRYTKKKPQKIGDYFVGHKEDTSSSGGEQQGIYDLRSQGKAKKKTT